MYFGVKDLCKVNYVAVLAAYGWAKDDGKRDCGKAHADVSGNGEVDLSTSATPSVEMTGNAETAEHAPLSHSKASVISTERLASGEIYRKKQSRPLHFATATVEVTRKMELKLMITRMLCCLGETRRKNCCLRRGCKFVESMKHKIL